MISLEKPKGIERVFNLGRSHGLRLLARTVGGIYGTIGSYKGIIGVVLRCILVESLVKINEKHSI